MTNNSRSLSVAKKKKNASSEGSVYTDHLGMTVTQSSLVLRSRKKFGYIIGEVEELVEDNPSHDD